MLEFDIMIDLLFSSIMEKKLNKIRQFGLRTWYVHANVGPKGESGFQARLQLVDDAIERLPSRMRFSKKRLIAGHSK